MEAAWGKENSVVPNWSNEKQHTLVQSPCLETVTLVCTLIVEISFFDFVALWIWYETRNVLSARITISSHQSNLLDFLWDTKEERWTITKKFQQWKHIYDEWNCLRISSCFFLYIALWCLEKTSSWKRLMVYSETSASTSIFSISSSFFLRACLASLIINLKRRGVEVRICIIYWFFTARDMRDCNPTQGQYFR